jgi:hypothetical protein
LEAAKHNVEGQKPILHEIYGLPHGFQIFFKFFDGFFGEIRR